MTLQEAVLFYRSKHDLTQRQMAAKVGLEEQAIRALERNGRMPMKKHLPRYLELLRKDGIEVEYDITDFKR